MKLAYFNHQPVNGRKFFTKILPFWAGICVNFSFTWSYVKNFDLDITGKIGIISTIGKVRKVGRDSQTRETMPIS